MMVSAQGKPSMGSNDLVKHHTHHLSQHEWRLGSRKRKRRLRLRPSEGGMPGPTPTGDETIPVWTVGGGRLSGLGTEGGRADEN